MINFEYTRAGSTKSASEARLKQSSSQFIAGGTNLVDLMKKGIIAPEKLIDINGLPLKDIKSDAKGIHIGALVPNSVAAENESVKKMFPLLSMALNAGASAQLRNMATVGGNIMQRTRCSYFYDIQMPCNKRKPGSGCGALQGYHRMHAIFGASNQCIAVHPSDMCVALTALDATIHLSGTKTQRNLAFGEFHRLPGNSPELDNNLQAGELITGVTIPVNSYNKSYYLKIRDRLSYAFALVSVAVALDIREGRIHKAAIAMGGVAHKPWRLPAVEAILKDKAVSPSLFAEAAEAAMENAATYEHNRYKIKLGKAAIREALSKAAGII